MKLFNQHLLSISFLLLITQSIAHANEARTLVERGFIATYRMESPRLPAATVNHTLTHNGNRIESKMTGSSFGVASGHERSYFISQQDDLIPLLYSSGYGAFGFKKRYQIQPGDLNGKLDRQMMIYQLSRDARSGHCTEVTPCQLKYVDHKAREKSIAYHQIVHPEPEDPDEVQYPITLKVIEKDGQRPLTMSFHPEYLGLIVEAEMSREDKGHYRLILNDVIFDN